MNRFLIFVDMCLGQDILGEYTTERYFVVVQEESLEEAITKVDNIILAPFKGVMYGRPFINGIKMCPTYDALPFESINNIKSDKEEYDYYMNLYSLAVLKGNNKVIYSLIPKDHFEEQKVNSILENHPDMDLQLIALSSPLKNILFKI